MTQFSEQFKALDKAQWHSGMRRSFEACGESNSEDGSGVLEPAEPCSDLLPEQPQSLHFCLMLWQAADEEGTDTLEQDQSTQIQAKTQANKHT